MIKLSSSILTRTLPFTLRILLRAGLLSSLACVVQCREAPRGMSLVSGPTDAALADAVQTADRRRLEATARDNPLEFLMACRRHCELTVHDYSCTFLKQERIGRELRPEQQIAVQFRESPFSVHMKWLTNPGGATEASYVAGRWQDEDGNEMALFKPAGVLALLAPEIRLAIHGPHARKDSRRSLDQFGFRNTLDLIIRYCRLARDDPQFGLAYTGAGRLDGRDTFTFERHLPFTVEDRPWPDRLLVVHIDQEWLLPVACFAYADDAREQLLGSYVFTQVQLNVGVPAEQFDTLASRSD